MDPLPRQDLILTIEGSEARVCTPNGDDHTRGIVLRCPPVPRELTAPRTEQYISLARTVFKPHAHEKADFFYLCGASDFRALRASVLALTDLTGRTIIAELAADDDGRMEDGTDLLAAAGVLQRIGVSTLMLTARTREQLTEALERLSLYVRVSIGVRLPTLWLREDIPLAGVEIFSPLPGEDADAFRAALAGWEGAVRTERDHDDLLLVPDGRDAHFIPATVDISDEIPCDHRLYERLLEAEDEEAAVLKLVIEDEGSVIDLEDDLYMLSRPVCLCADTPELLERALRVFHGLAIYDGTWEQEPEHLRWFEEKYGLIRL